MHEAGTAGVAVTVWRQEPAGEPWPQAAEVPCAPTTTVLDVLEWLKAGPAPSLAFRSSCRSGICGSCGVMVNGRPVLACETNAAGYWASGLVVQPLARLAVLRDLITDTEGFIARLRESLAWRLPPAIVQSARPDGAPASSTPAPVIADAGRTGDWPPPAIVETAANAPAPVIVESARPDDAPATNAPAPDDDASPAMSRQTPEQLAAYRALAECVNCLLCYAACPVFPQLAFPPSAAPDAVFRASDPPTDQVPEFIGPAALALARRWDLDSRDDGAEQRAAAVIDNEFGVWPCTQDGSCTRVCPKGVDPKRAIGAMQRLAMG